MNENLVFDTDEYLKFMKNHDFDEDNLHSFIWFRAFFCYTFSISISYLSSCSEFNFQFCSSSFFFNVNFKCL